MNKMSPVPALRRSRTSVAILLAYLVLFAPLASISAQTVKVKRAPAPQGSPQQGKGKVGGGEKQVTLPNAIAAPVIVATKTDSFPDPDLDGKALPGATITYTVTITNNGDAPATGVTFTDSVDPNTSLVPGSVTTTPIANADSASAFGNVRISTANGAPNLLANDCDPDPAGGPCTNAGLTASGPTTSTQGGNVVVNSDGTFSYNPAPGFTGSDTFTYTATDGTGKTDTATVTITVGPTLIWFINNDPGAPAGNDGRITSPFNSIASYIASSPTKDPNDIIFIYQGTSAYTGNLTLTSGMKLIGQGFALQTETGAPPAGSDALPGATSNPTINSAAGNTVTLNTNNTIRGVTLNNSAGIDITGSTFGTLTVSNVTISGTGRPLSLTTGTLAATFDQITATAAPGGQGILLSSVGGSMTVTSGTSITGAGTQGILVTGSTVSANFGNTSISGGSDGVSLQNNSSGTRTFGTLGVSGGSASAFLHGAGGGNTTVTGAATLASTGNPIDIQTAGAAVISFSGGATATKTSAGGAGVNLVASSVTFESLGITTSNGPGLSAITSGTITVTNGTKAISATGSAGQAAPAIIANAVTLNANFSGVSSTNSGNAANGTGVSLTNVAGTSNFGTGAISGSSGDAFFASGGAGSVTYNGTIASGSAHSVNVTGKSGGTLNFGAAITDTDTGITLTSNPSTTINFTGGLSLTTGASPAFTATGGGTVNATQNNTSILNVVSTTTGTGVNIQTPTNIGGSGVTFRSVTVNNGASNSATNAIILNGTTGTFLVSGDGAQTSGFFNRNGTGGTINRTTGHSVLLTNATNVTLRQLNITNTAVGPTGAGGCPDNCNSDAIRSSGGGTIVLSAVTLQNLGGNGWRANNITGTNAVNNNTLVDTWNTASTNGVSVAILTPNNYSGTFTVDRCKFTTSATGADGFLFDVDTNGGNGTVSVTNSEFTAIDQDAVQINHDGAGILNALVQSNNFHDADATAGDGNNTLVLVLTGGGEFKFNIDSNAFTNLARLSANSGVLQVQAAGGAAGSSTGAKLNGTIQNNTLTNPGFVSQRRGIMAATEASAGNHGGHIISIKNNSVQGFFLHGIYTSFTSVNGSDNLGNNLNISNNQVGTTGAVGQGGGDSGSAIELETNVAADGSGGDISVNALIQGNTAVSNNSSGIGDTLDISNLSGPTTGAGNSSTMNLTILGNTLTQSNAGGQVFEARNVLTPTTTMCLDLNSGNTSPNTATGGNGTGFRLTNDAGVYSIEGLGASTPAAFLGPRNSGTITATGTFINSAGCANSTAPIAPPEITVPDQSAASQPSGVTEQVAPTFQGPINQPFVSLPQAAQPAQAVAQIASAPQVASVDAEQPPVSKAEGGAKNSPATSSSSSKTTSPVVINGAGGTVSINIGTLNPADSVTITFQVVVDSPYNGPANVSNQGTVSGSNFSNVLTDDPAVAGTNNPTLTPIFVVHIRVNDAKVSEPAAGTSQMLFTVTLSGPAPVGGLTLNYATANGGATPATGGATCGGSVDYETTSGILTFAQGESVRTIPVNVCADTDSPETNETFLMNISGASGGIIDDAQAVGTITQGNDPGTFLISELRTSGPGGAGDDFVELYNNTGSPLTVASSDASAGYGVYKMGTDCNAAPVLIGTVPNGTVIPSRGHYLLVGSQYGLGAYAAGNLTMTSDIEVDHNVAVFSTADVNALSTSAKLDAVGFTTNTGGVCDLLREGNNLPPMAANPSVQYSFFRKMETGFPQDTNDNAADFRFADTQGTFISGVVQQLGAPGPENLASPLLRTSTIKSSLLDATAASTVAPNRVRDLTSVPANNSTFGTLSIRRRFTNNTGGSVTRLRFRVAQMTTFPSPGGGVADVRAINSTSVSVSGINDATTCPGGITPCTVTVQGTTLEQPPTQPNGGGYNSSMAAGTVTLGTPLAPGASINLQFLLGVQTTGSFTFLVTIEALP